MIPEIRRAAFEAVGYTPNPVQLAIHDDHHFLKLVAGGERAGKSHFTGMEVYGDLAGAELVWLVGPDYHQAKPEFRYIRDALQKLDAIERLLEPETGSQLLITRGGIRIVTRSGEDVVKLASEAPHVVAMVEAAQHRFENFTKLHNRLLEARKRGRAAFIVSGTFEGSLGWYPELFNELQGANVWLGKSFSLPTWSNLALFAKGWDDPEIRALRARLPADLFSERFGGVPVPPRDLVFGEFRHMAHVVPIRFGEGEELQRDETGWALPAKQELEVWVDPGYAGAYAVLFVAIVGGLVFVVDEVYAAGKTGEQIITDVTAKRELFERVRRGVMDVAGRQHNAMESQLELWQRMTGLALRSSPVAIADGISRHRTFLVDPFTTAPRLFHDPKCKGTVAEYGKYRYPEYVENRDERELPIDANNHAMKAIAYGLFDRFGVVERLSKPEPRNLARRPEKRSVIGRRRS